MPNTAYFFARRKKREQTQFNPLPLRISCASLIYSTGLQESIYDETFKDVLESETAKDIIHIIFNHLHRFEPAYAELLADSLRSAKLPPNLTITCKSCAINDEVFKIFVDALASETCPTDLTLDFTDNEISDNGLKYLADAINAGKYPSNLTINLEWNHEITSTGIKALAEALNSEQASKQNLRIKTDEVPEVLEVPGVPYFGFR